MEDPLLNKTEHNVNVTINGDTSSNDEHIVNITTDDRSLSTHEQTPHEAEGVESCVPCTEENVMNLIDFVFTLVQIVAAIVVVTRAEDKHPEAALLIWIIGYTCASIASLLFLCCQLWHYSVSLDTRLCVAFLAFSFIRYVVHNLTCTAFCVAILCLTWFDAVQEGISPNIMLAVGILACVLGLLDYMFPCR
ncbi:unnamed protein product [Arabidopsis thaliana]|uniref:Transmembrane protein n=1 Tax=Arabidopsis thaliana TaxID=3702 RepID=A0A5S9XHR5_ARATH|nr:unnamed protein product [Arabidopsis thaliana]